MLSHAFVERLFGLPGIKVCALLNTLDCINNFVKFVSGSYILGINQFLSQRIVGAEMNWDDIFEKILLNFSDTSTTYGMTMLWGLFLSSTCVVGVVPGVLS